MKKTTRLVTEVIILIVVAISVNCVVGTKENGQPDYPEKWEQAILETDEFGAELIVVRENGETWRLESKTFCFWARNYVGRSIWLKWGPVQSMIMNDNGETCEMWTQERLGDWEQ